MIVCLPSCKRRGAFVSRTASNGAEASNAKTRRTQRTQWGFGIPHPRPLARWRGRGALQPAARAMAVPPTKGSPSASAALSAVPHLQRVEERTERLIEYNCRSLYDAVKARAALPITPPPAGEGHGVGASARAAGFVPLARPSGPGTGQMFCPPLNSAGAGSRGISPRSGLRNPSPALKGRAKA